MSDLYPFDLTKINVFDPNIDVITFVYDVDQIPPDPSLDFDIDPDANFTYVNGFLTRIDFTTGDYKTFTYIDNVGGADHELLLTLFDSFSSTTKTFIYSVNGVLANITVA